MKPLKLSISGFLSYATLQEIDFTKLGKSGLYLITGQTGAGKTTIFDAISYALYGTTSGSGRDKNILRSHFITDKTKTFVALDFAIGSETYSIKRSITPSSVSADLTLPCGTVVTGIKPATDKIKEILGIDQSQFAQIVMIAQNDFAKFLESNTSDRVAILRNIFDTKSISAFQAALATRASEAKKKLDQLIHQFATLGTDQYNFDNHLQNWQAEIKMLDKNLATAKTQRDQNHQAHNHITTALAIAKNISEKFQSLAQKETELQTHQQNQPTITQLQATVEKSEKALYTIKPLQEKYQTLQDSYTTTAAAITQGQADQKQAEIHATNTATTLENLPDPTRIQQLITQLETNLAREEALKKNLLNAQNNYNNLTAYRSTYQQNTDTLQRINQQRKQADQQYKTTYESFFANQAGIFGEMLQPNTPCPICGATTHPNPAKKQDQNITEAVLKKSKQDLDTISKKFEAQSTTCQELKGKIAELSHLLQDNLQTILPQANKDNLSTLLPQSITNATNTIQGMVEQLTEHKTTLVNLTTSIKQAQAQKSAAEAKLSAINALITERTQAKATLALQLQAAKAAYATALVENLFTNAQDYKQHLLTEAELKEKSATIDNFYKTETQLITQITTLQAETAGQTPPDLPQLTQQAQALTAEKEALDKNYDILLESIAKLSPKITSLKTVAKQFATQQETHNALEILANVASGKSGDRFDFETYAQVIYFDQVLAAANKRLHLMSHAAYTLRREETSTDRRKSFGLGVEVFDRNTGLARKAQALSGGEKFMASLSLALGLSDVVQQYAGGIRLDAMFIDEGFGTLDTEKLDLAIKTLSEMAGTHRIVGIISHVTELKERIDTQIKIEKTPQGSLIKIGG